jgi:hypothetical protein
MLPDFDRADTIGSYWGNPKTRTFAELLIDLEEDKAAKEVEGLAEGDGARLANQRRTAAGRLKLGSTCR